VVAAAAVVGRQILRHAPLWQKLDVEAAAADGGRFLQRPLRLPPLRLPRLWLPSPLPPLSSVYTTRATHRGGGSPT